MMSCISHALKRHLYQAVVFSALILFVAGLCLLKAGVAYHLAVVLAAVGSTVLIATPVIRLFREM